MGYGEMVSLDALPRGSVGLVREVTGRENVRKRLMELGFVPGTRVTMLRRAPLKGAVEVRLRGYSLALRGSDARGVSLEIIEERRDTALARGSATEIVGKRRDTALSCGSAVEIGR